MALTLFKVLGACKESKSILVELYSGGRSDFLHQGEHHSCGTVTDFHRAFPVSISG